MKRGKRARRFSDYVRIVIHQREAPEAIALGVCIGLVAGLSPLYGLQMTLAFLLALLFRGSKIAAVLLVWVTNPFTAIPIYSFNYWIGSRVLGFPVEEKPFLKFVGYCLREVRWGNLDEIRVVLQKALALGRGILLPMAIGGLLVSFAISLVAYPLTRLAVGRFRKARGKRLRATMKKSEREEGE